LLLQDGASQKGAPFSFRGTFARLAQPFFALEFAGDAAPIFAAQRDKYYMEKKWSAQILRDPYYSPNLLLHSRGFDLAFPPKWENEAAITEAE
jgi:hypothetical protein